MRIRRVCQSCGRVSGEANIQFPPGGPPEHVVRNDPALMDRVLASSGLGGGRSSCRACGGAVEAVVVDDNTPMLPPTAGARALPGSATVPMGDPSPPRPAWQGRGAGRPGPVHRAAPEGQAGPAVMAVVVVVLVAGLIIAGIWGAVVHYSPSTGQVSPSTPLVSPQE
jgi:hypothetical protein